MKKELDRLQKLSDLDIDYENQKGNLDQYVELAKFITDSPICEIHIIDAYNQWPIARTENSLAAMAREKSVCQHTIHQDTIYEIPNLSISERYQDRFYVADEPHLRYYCGAQLTTSDGFNIGSICVLDIKSKEISAQQKKQLEHLAQIVVDHIERESKYSKLSEKLDELKYSLRNLNHDVRSPINGIVGIADILLDDAESNPDLPKQEIAMIKDSAQAVIEKIDGVLSTIDTGDGSRIDGGQTTLSSVSKKVKRMYNPLALQKNHSLTVENQINEEVSIPKNFSVTLTQIIGNLVGNAIKFTPEGGAITVVFTHKAEEDKQMLDITVEDNGKGMTPNQIKAFNSGQPVERSKGTSEEKSFGIGLDHIRQLVAQQNGSIVAGGNKEQGTRFSIRIPLPAVNNSED